tara:strand:+ start:1027 stop:1395 length:369 start_codon:yes stop_codon:yes gene_type:complete
MAISYTWDVKKVETYPSHTDSQDPANTESDVIYLVHWRLTGEDDVNNDADGNPQKADVYGSIGLDVSNLASFTSFASVNQAQVQGWAEAAIGADQVTEYKRLIDAKIAKQITPDSVGKTINS